MTSLATMNYLFYLGIVLPTLITVLLFLVFLGCWRRLSARTEVLTKRHDPHGRMRALGLPLLPPPPPLCVRSCSLRLGELGNSNDGFSSVSRSPLQNPPTPGGLAVGGPGLYQTVPAPDSGLGPELLDLLPSPGGDSLAMMAVPGGSGLGGPGRGGLGVMVGPGPSGGISGCGVSKMAMSPLGVSGMGVSGVPQAPPPSHAGGSGGAAAVAVGGAGGAGGGTSGKDRPESQASHGSSDSQDSGFRSSRSGQYLAGATGPHPHPHPHHPPSQETPLLRTPRDPPPSTSFTRSRSEHLRDWCGGSRGVTGPQQGGGGWSGGSSGRARNPTPGGEKPPSSRGSPDHKPPSSEAPSPSSPHCLRQLSPHSLAHFSPKRLNTFSQPEGAGGSRHPPQTLDLQDISLGGQAGWRLEDGGGPSPLTPKAAPRHHHPQAGCGGTHTTAIVHSAEGETDLMGYSVV